MKKIVDTLVDLAGAGVEFRDGRFLRDTLKVSSKFLCRMKLISVPKRNTIRLRSPDFEHLGGRSYIAKRWGGGMRRLK